MRLKLKIATAQSRIEKINLSAELVELLDEYVKYYQTSYGNSVTTEKVIVEMLTAFMRSDHGFMKARRPPQDVTTIEKKRTPLHPKPDQTTV